MTYRKLKLAWKVHIRWKKTRIGRFFATIWYVIAFPWVLLLYKNKEKKQ